MKKLILHTALFLLPVVILVLIIPVDKRMKYAGLKNDCFNHGIWIYDRIHYNPDPVDIAFLGSSHTINGIDDRIISEGLTPIKAANFGYCRLGRNLDYVLLKEILKKKKISKLVVEVREREDRYSHPVFPYIASTPDVALPNPLFNRDIFKDVWYHLSYKIETVQDVIYKRDSIPDYRIDDYGFAGHYDTASASFLDEIKIKRNLPKKEDPSYLIKFYLSYPRGYLKKTGQICKENQIALYFLYLPSYGNQKKVPEALSLYRELGTILIPPDTIFDNPLNWHDENHLNNNGARLLSQWLADQL
ncbi:MAG: hypothetical protein RBS55_13705 [Bacteroidales bacterium]|jgi:hypothetical protein|nr:hypothetical protein [Bacteroidales bacterium]